MFRKTAEADDFTTAATVDAPEWTDTTTEFGKPYSYQVQTLAPLDNNKQAESDLSAEATLTPVDKFPPATPAGLHADAAPASIELAWTRGPEPDLAGYRIYRSVAGGPFETTGALSQTPAWSDRSAEHGKTYRYQVTALDQAGNESPRSPAVEVTYP